MIYAYAHIMIGLFFYNFCINKDVLESRIKTDFVIFLFSLLVVVFWPLFFSYFIFLSIKHINEERKK